VALVAKSVCRYVYFYIFGEVMSCSNSEMFTLDFRGTVVLDYTAWECFSGKRVFALNCFS